MKHQKHIAAMSLYDSVLLNRVLVLLLVFFKSMLMQSKQAFVERGFTLILTTR